MVDGVIDIELGGAKRTLRFNNFAHVEIAKALFQNGSMTATPNELLNRLHEIANDNIMLLMKILVYGGIAGNDYLTGFKVSVTQQEVGEMLSKCDDSELIGVWEVFLEAMGMTLPKQEGEEVEEGLEEKKK